MTGTPQTYAQFGEEAGAIMWSMHRHITQLERERDDMRQLLIEAANKLECHINSNWPFRVRYRHQMIGWEVDMEFVNKIRAAVDGEN